jgi:hypothetical protein
MVALASQILSSNACSTDNDSRATIGLVKSYIHARLGAAERKVLEQLKAATGASESELVRRGLELVAAVELRRPSALELAGSGVGRFTSGPRDLSTSATHLTGFGE